jgi:excisionase family DNA binding protein
MANETRERAAKAGELLQKRQGQANENVGLGSRSAALEAAAPRLTPLVFTVGEAAVLLRCSQEVVYQLIYSGQLRALRPSRRFIIPRAALDAFLGGAFTAK